MTAFELKMPAKRLFAAGCLATVLVAFSTPVNASSDSAWDEFQAEVGDACQSAVADFLDTSVIVVDPFGSESYGIAVLTGYERGGDGIQRSYVCVFDKVSQSVEIGSPLELAAH